jgi:acyl carrier protein
MDNQLSTGNVLNPRPAGSQTEVVAELTAMLGEILGPEVIEIIPIRSDTEFLKDLGMNSIQVVSLAEMVAERYGERVDFIGWISGKSMRQLTRLSLGQVAAMIARS